jgi:hypothetical protein
MVGTGAIEYLYPAGGAALDLELGSREPEWRT